MKQLHIYAYGDVMNIQDAEASEHGIISLKGIVDALIANPDAKEIVVHIHSGGGDVYEGFAIHDALKNSGKKITTIIEGLCASIATVIALAGSIRQMTKNSEFMIHNPWSMGFGTADEMQKQTDYVRTAEDKLINFYAEKTGQDAEEIKAMMKEETYMSPQKAETLGFITEVLEEVNAKKSRKIYATINKKSKNMKTKKEKLEAAKKLEAKRIADKKLAAKKTLDKKAILNKLTAYLDKIIGEDENEVEDSIDFKTKDGKSVSIETDADTPKVGDAVTVDGASAPDETLEMEDGTVIETDSDSNIEAIETSTEEEEEKTGTDAKEIKKLKAQIKKLKAEKEKNEEEKGDDDDTDSDDTEDDDTDSDDDDDDEEENDNKAKSQIKKLKADLKAEKELTAKINETLIAIKKSVKSSYVPKDEETRFRKKKGDEEEKGEGIKSFREQTKARREVIAKKLEAQ